MFNSKSPDELIALIDELEGTQYEITYAEESGEYEELDKLCFFLAQKGHYLVGVLREHTDLHPVLDDIESRLPGGAKYMDARNTDDLKFSFYKLKLSLAALSGKLLAERENKNSMPFSPVPAMVSDNDMVQDYPEPELFGGSGPRRVPFDKNPLTILWMLSEVYLWHQLAVKEAEFLKANQSEDLAEKRKELIHRLEKLIHDENASSAKKESASLQYIALQNEDFDLRRPELLAIRRHQLLCLLLGRVAAAWNLSTTSFRESYLWDNWHQVTIPESNFPPIIDPLLDPSEVHAVQKEALRRLGTNSQSDGYSMDLVDAFDDSIAAIFTANRDKEIEEGQSSTNTPVSDIDDKPPTSEDVPVTVSNEHFSVPSEEASVQDKNSLDMTAEAILAETRTLTDNKKNVAKEIRRVLQNKGYPLTRQQISIALELTDGTGDFNKLCADLVKIGYLIKNSERNGHRGYGLPEWREVPTIQ